MAFLTWIKENLPFVKSPRFWGIVATAVFGYVRAKGWLGESEMEFLRNVSAAATLVGFTGWAVDKSRVTKYPEDV